MAATILPPYVGGAEAGPYFIRLLDGSEAVIDLTGFEYRAEVWWDGCARITLSEGAGITRLADVPISPDDSSQANALRFHYSWGLTETQAKCVPVGVTPVKLYYISPGQVTTIDVVNLKRTL